MPRTDTITIGNTMMFTINHEYFVDLTQYLLTEKFDVIMGFFVPGNARLTLEGINTEIGPVTNFW